MQLYGIATCDSVKAVRKQLDQNNIPYHFIDLKTTPPDAATIRRWHEALGDALINTQSRTWREHRDMLQAARAAGDTAFYAALAAQPLVLKRPIIENAHGVAVGKSAWDTLRQHA